MEKQNFGSNEVTDTLAYSKFPPGRDQLSFKQSLDNRYDKHNCGDKEQFHYTSSLNSGEG